MSGINNPRIRQVGFSAPSSANQPPADYVSTHAIGGSTSAFASTPPVPMPTTSYHHTPSIAEGEENPTSSPPAESFLTDSRAAKEGLTDLADSEPSTPSAETGTSAASSMRDESVTTTSGEGAGSVKAVGKGEGQKGAAGKKSESSGGKDLVEGGKDGGESKKPTTKAERRALQEAQRAAKAAAKGGGAPQSKASQGGKVAGKEGKAAAGGGGKQARDTATSSSDASSASEGHLTAARQSGDGVGSSGVAGGAAAGVGGGGGSVGEVVTASVPSGVGMKSSASLLQRMAQVGAIPPKERVELFRHLQQSNRSALLAFLEEHFLEEEEGEGAASIHPAVYELGLRYLLDHRMDDDQRTLLLLQSLRSLILSYHPPESPSQPLSRDLSARLNSHVGFLLACRPMSPAMGNAVRHVKACVAGLQPEVEEGEAKASVLGEIDRYIEEKILFASHEVVRHALTKIRPSDSKDLLLTYAYCPTVKAALLAAASAGMRFRVAVADAGPHFEGRRMLRELSEEGISCTYMHINAVPYAMKEVSRVLLGASAVMANGSVYARVGTAAVAAIAASKKVPCLVCCASHKFHERCQMDSITHNEIGDPDDVIRSYTESTPGKPSPLAAWRETNSLRPLNLLYDLAPASLITGIVTEIGIVPPSSVAVILREYRKDVLLGA